jgi:hypothetical protein
MLYALVALLQLRGNVAMCVDSYADVAQALLDLRVGDGVQNVALKQHLLNTNPFATASSVTSIITSLYPPQSKMIPPYGKS